MERNLRTKELLGNENFDILKESCVAVFGIGGVGSYAAEALARSGIGTIYLYDCDTVSKSNINRQIIALESTLSRDKAEIMKQRIFDINPEINVYAFKEFIGKESLLPFGKFDFIIDAVDNVTAKLFLIENAEKNGVQIISVMGTGNKLNPESLKISKIEKTHTCPLCKVVRCELKKRNIKNISVVWSDEEPKRALSSKEKTSLGRPTPASMIFVPSSAGILAAKHVVTTLINKK